MSRQINTMFGKLVLCSANTVGSPHITSTPSASEFVRQLSNMIFTSLPAWGDWGYLSGTVLLFDDAYHMWTAVFNSTGDYPKIHYLKSVQLQHDLAIHSSIEDLTSLPGVSHYIASAVRCFAFGYPDALLDTNTVRVSGRIFGLPVSDSSRRSKLFREVLERLLDQRCPREFNWTLIDFAWAICRPKTHFTMIALFRMNACTTGGQSVKMILH